MKDRYEIEELVVQDESGVVFRARDRQEDGEVAVRRFFPLEAPGAGFDAEEREGYAGTVEALKTLKHESLCGVLDGGVDEVDGIPYLVTEWPGGETLSAMLERGPLAAEQAVAIAGQGLEVLQLLGSVFGEGVEWLEMEAVAVLVDEESGVCSFTIDPLQVLDVAKRDGGVRGLASLLDLAMGWNGRVVPPGAAAGLGGWVASAKSGKWTVTEAYHELVKIRSVWTGEAVPEEAPPAPPQAPAPVSQSPGPTFRPAPVARAPMNVYSARSRGSAGMVAGLLFGAVVLLGLGIWLGVAQPWKRPVASAGEDGPAVVKVIRKEAAPPPVAAAAAAPRDRELTPQERVDEILRNRGGRDEGEPDETTPVASIEKPEDPAPARRTPKEPDPEPEMPAVFGPGDGAKMRDWLGEEAVVEGTLFRVRDSKSGKTRYLEFSDDVGQDVLCVRTWPSDGIDVEDLKRLEGKALRFKGKIAVEAGTGRIVLHVKSRSQISEAG